MSNIDMAAVRFVPLYTIWLMRDTSHENRALYKALAKASRASRAWSMLNGVTTRSFRASCNKFKRQNKLP